MTLSRIFFLLMPLLNRIDSIPASEKAGTLYLRIYPYVDPDKITTMFLFATSPLLSQSGNAKLSIKGNTLNSDSLNWKSPCSSSLYKRRHCLPSVTARMRFFFRINAYGCTSRKSNPIILPPDRQSARWHVRSARAEKWNTPSFPPWWCRH